PTYICTLSIHAALPISSSTFLRHSFVSLHAAIARIFLYCSGSRTVYSPVPLQTFNLQLRCSFINVCSSLQSLLCLFERNIALQPKIQGNLGVLYAQNDVSVSKLQFRFKVFIPRIPSVFRYRGKSLALLI